jgi:hypothetical protein
MITSTTITATELRKNLDEVLARVEAGQEITVKHRFRMPVVMSSQVAKKPPGMPGLDAFLAIPRKPSTLDHSKSIKQLYAESIGKKYGF